VNSETRRLNLIEGISPGLDLDLDGKGKTVIDNQPKETRDEK